MYGLPEKQLSFLLCAGCDTLPTPMNLARWNIITSPKCALCQATQPTTNHILTRCPVALDQGRYSWRYDSVIQVLVCALQQHLPECLKLYADLPGYLASVCLPSTIPTNLSSTLSRPDLVLVSSNSICLPSNIFWLLELGRKTGIAVYNMTFSLLAYLLISFLSRLVV